MDSKQTWYGSYFKLEAISDFLKNLPEDHFKRAKPHELFMTWVVARFLQARTSVEHFVGFPSLEGHGGRQLSEFVFGSAALDDTNFDTVIVNAEHLETHMRIQVKRYMNREHPSTDDLFNYIKEKSARDGRAPEINLVFHVHHGFRFDSHRFRQLAQNCSFNVGAIWVFVELLAMKQKCALFEVHPRLAREWWSPSSE